MCICIGGARRRRNWMSGGPSATRNMPSWGRPGILPWAQAGRCGAYGTFSTPAGAARPGHRQRCDTRCKGRQATTFEKKGSGNRQKAGVLNEAPARIGSWRIINPMEDGRILQEGKRAQAKRNKA